MYLQVDKHIRRLDADLARFENELKEKLEVSGYESTEGRGVKSKFANCWLSILKKKTNGSLHCLSGCFYNMLLFSTEGETQLREKRGSRGRKGRKGSDEDSPKKKKMKNRCV